MTVRKRILLSMSIVLFGLVIGLYATSRNLLLGDFIEIERQNLRQEVRRAVDALSEEINQLDVTANDWSPSEGTYEFIKTGNTKYIKSSLSPTALRRLSLDLVVFADRQGKVLLSRCVDRGTAKTVPIPDEFRARLFPHSLLVDHEDERSVVKGLMLVEDQPMLVSSRPILSGEAKGPVQGSIIVGRYLNSVELEKIRSRIDIPIEIRSIAADVRVSVLDSVSPNSTRKAPVNVKPLSENKITGAAYLRDIYGKPVLTLGVDRERTVYIRGKAGMRYYLISLLFIGLFFGLLVELLLEKHVLSRLESLSRSVSGIGKGGNLSSRISLSGKDELSRLASSMNDMLNALEMSQGKLRKQEALRESEERYRGLVEMSPDAVLILSENKCVFANASAANLLNSVCPDGLIGKDLFSIVHSDCQNVLERQLGDLYSGDEAMLRFEGRLIRLDGTTVDVEIAGILFSYQSKAAVQLVARDMTEKKKYEQQLDHLAHHDPLTGLPNRLLFSDRLHQRLSHSRRHNEMMAVMFIDLDRFKLINDTLGHNVGDLLLKEAARRLETCVRDGDTIARMGGDEFTIILTGLATPDDAIVVANRALESLAQPFNLQEHELFVSASMGISIFPTDGRDVETLVKNADAAMYKAKESGRNNCQVYTEELNAAVTEKMKLETDLRKALEKDQFVLCYQPRVDLHTGKSLGMEALVRWKHPEYGLIQPLQFIPLAEETGLIIPISEWVIRTACTQNKVWHDSGFPPVSMAVNISARHFQQGDLAATVRRILEETGLDAKYLELEVTEGTLMQDTDHATTMLKELQDMGVLISVDDFGTGYSSLTYLKSLPLNTIKIDQSFVKEINTNPDDAAIAGAVVAMAHSLNLKVIAEGVETVDQLEFLRALKCDEMQGYFVSRPVPPEEFTQFLQDQMNLEQETQPEEEQKEAA